MTACNSLTLCDPTDTSIKVLVANPGTTDAQAFVLPEMTAYAGAIADLVKCPAAPETVSVLTPNADGSFTHFDGTSQSVSIPAPPAPSSLVINPDGSATHSDGQGTDVTIPAEVGQAVVTPDTDGGGAQLNTTTIQGTDTDGTVTSDSVINQLNQADGTLIDLECVMPDVVDACGQPFRCGDEVQRVEPEAGCEGFTVDFSDAAQAPLTAGLRGGGDLTGDELFALPFNTWVPFLTLTHTITNPSTCRDAAFFTTARWGNYSYAMAGGNYVRVRLIGDGGLQSPSIQMYTVGKDLAPAPPGELLWRETIGTQTSVDCRILGPGQSFTYTIDGHVRVNTVGDATHPGTFILSGDAARDAGPQVVFDGHKIQTVWNLI